MMIATIITGATVVALSLGAYITSKRVTRLDSRIRALEQPPKRQYSSQEYWDMYVKNTGNPYNLTQDEVRSFFARTSDTDVTEPPTQP